MLCIKVLYKTNILVKLNHDLSVHEDVIPLTFFLIVPHLLSQEEYFTLTVTCSFYLRDWIKRDSVWLKITCQAFEHAKTTQC